MVYGPACISGPHVARRPPLEVARARLRAVLNHPAFTPERRQKAETLLLATTDAPQLRRWADLALSECWRWEDATLAREEGPPVQSYPC